MKNPYARLIGLIACALLFALNLTARNITLTAQVTNVHCNGDCTGAIHLVVTCGISPYNYDWNNDGSETPDNDSRDINGLCVGLYCVTVTDATGSTFST